MFTTQGEGGGDLGMRLAYVCCLGGRGRGGGSNLGMRLAAQGGGGGGGEGLGNEASM